MDRIAPHLVVKNYDLLGPLACCEVTRNWIDLTLERDAQGFINRPLPWTAVFEEFAAVSARNTSA